MNPRPPILFDRSTGHLDGASMVERVVARAFQASSKASSLYHHRGFSVGCRALAPVIGERDIDVQLNDDAHFTFPFGDGYWSLLLDRSFSYEDEINRVLASLADVDYAFLDCGANFGFWSVLVSSRPYGSHPALAVEASTSNYAKLARNATLNGKRFKTLHGAVGEVAGTAWLHGHKHEALSIRDDQQGPSGEQVEVLTLNSLLEDRFLRSRSRLVVKLDVEGMEIAAIKSGQRLLDRDAILIVEDHGSDRDHTVSRYILEHTPFRIFVLDPRDQSYKSVTDVSMLDQIKTNSSIGYNVFATQSRFWEERLMLASRDAWGHAA